jgi:hypothetical protein
VVAPSRIGHHRQNTDDSAAETPKAPGFPQTASARLFARIEKGEINNAAYAKENHLGCGAG